MNPKTIQSHVQFRGGICEIAILSGDMHRAYMLLDMLAEGAAGEIHLQNAADGKTTPIQKSADGKNIAWPDGVCLTADGIGCIKRLIAQCSLNPYDAQWMHYDLDAYTPKGEEIELCVRIA